MIKRKKQFASILFGACAFGYLMFPHSVFAASVYATVGSKEIYQGDVFVVDAMISSPDARLNVADGSIVFDANTLEVKELSTGGSIFSIWAEQPTVSRENNNGQVHFVGGTPAGFQANEGLLLKIIFFAKEEGGSELKFSKDFSVFASDGKGTKISPEQKSLSLSVIKRPAGIAPIDEWKNFISKDAVPPEPFEGIISRDGNLFDNQYFVSFFTTDQGSGVAYYEIKEGKDKAIRVESPYLLRDQSLQSVVQIKAVDKAGNERIATLQTPPTSLKISYVTYGIIVLCILLGLLLFMLRSFRKTKSK